MVTKQRLKKKIEKYKEELGKLPAEGKDQDRSRLRTFRKRLKRSQRKLAVVLRNEERVSGKTEG
ncbi:MAG: hypothetical protein JXQ83_02875 [Candidatus Glassbacteria bacterium]|nr:hypothetical protein [Candidatus Glassbacteria bacterium]